MSPNRISSRADSAQAKKPRRARKDRRGDENGVIEQVLGTISEYERGNLISARWVARAMEPNADDYRDLSAEGDDFAWMLEYVGQNYARNAAMALGFPALWRARKGRVTAGEVMDLGDLFAAGKGTVDQLVADLLAGKYADAPRDDEGFLILEQDGGE